VAIAATAAETEAAQGHFAAPHAAAVANLLVSVRFSASVSSYIAMVVASVGFAVVSAHTPLLPLLHC
jgi:hypothetical protein